MASSNGVVANSATMDYTNWAEMQQNPNPNLDPSLSNYSAAYYHNPSYPYQQYDTSIDPNTALLQSLPQPAPPGVDPPPQAVTYAQPTVSFEPHQGGAVAPYYPDPNVSWQPDPNVKWQPDPNVTWQPDPNVTWQPDPNVTWHQGPNVSWQHDPNASWPVAIPQFGAPTYAAGVTAPNPAFRPQRSKAPLKRKVIKKTTKVVQSAWCEVCKVACNTKEILDQHESGKKHKKNVEKLKRTSTSLPGPAPIAIAPAIVANPPPNVAKPPAIVANHPPNVAKPPANVATPPPNVATSTAAIVATPPVSVATSSDTLPVATLVFTDKQIIGPEKKPGKSKISKAKKLKRRRAAALTEDLETKKRKVMEGGVSENNVRECNICNVVCNSASVFDTHLAGQKHAAMAKKIMSMPEVAHAM